MKYTPGPWKYDQSGDYYRENVIRMNGVVIARMTLHCTGRDENAANAALIASAPELLQILKTILDVWDTDKIIGPMTYNDARAAIAKATEGGE